MGGGCGFGRRGFGKFGRGAAAGAVWLGLGLLAFIPSLPAVAGETGPALQRGFVSNGVAGRLVLQRCGPAGALAPALPLWDRSANRRFSEALTQVRQLRLEAEQPLYVEFLGRPEGRAGWAAQRLVRAVGHLHQCEPAPGRTHAGLNLQAQGGTPAWQLQTRAGGAQLRRDAGAEVQRFGPFTADRAASPKGAADPAGAEGLAQRYRAQSATAGVAALSLTLEDQVCLDEASETAFGLKAVLQQGADRREGCAMRR